MPHTTVTQTDCDQADPIEAARQDMVFEAAQELCGGAFNINPLVNRACTRTVAYEGL